MLQFLYVFNNLTKMKVFLAVVLISVSLNGLTQGQFISTAKKFNPATSISIFNNTFNSKDYYYGFSMGIEDLGYQWGARFNFQFRPFFKRTLIQESSSIVRQYREKKYFISFDFDKRFGNFDLGGLKTQLFLGTQLGVLLGNYRAARSSAEAVFNIVPVGGLSFNLKEDTFLKVGFCYLRDKLIEVPDGKISFNLIFTLKEPSRDAVEFQDENENKQPVDYY